MKLPQKNALEWTVFALSLALVVGLIGWLVTDGLRNSEDVPALVVRLSAPVVQGEQQTIAVTLANDGDQTVERARVQVSAGEEQAEIEFDRVPRGGEVEGVVTLPASAGAAEGQVVSWVVP